MVSLSFRRGRILSQPRALCLVRDQPHYRREAFVDGLRRAGYELVDHISPRPNDLLVTWNRYGGEADIWEREGGTVIVAENGYLGHDANGVQYYALAVGGHNGSGKWAVGGSERWDALGVELKPWRTEGEHIVIRAQRGIGSTSMASPPQWHVTASRDLRRLTDRRQVIQEHPGKPACDPRVAAQISESLIGAHAMCIWSSAAGVRALVEGVPVFYAAPHWICEGAAVRGVGNVERPKMNDADRLEALRRMAWAQWTIAEIATGEPFVLLRELVTVPDASYG